MDKNNAEWHCKRKGSAFERGTLLSLPRQCSVGAMVGLSVHVNNTPLLSTCQGQEMMWM